MTKLTKEQIEHYLKGGKFLAKYVPHRTDDISSKSLRAVNTEIKIWQNIIIAPIVEVQQFRGQHAFNADEVDGWFPEEDVEIIEMLDEFIDNVEPLPQYVYELYYNTREQVTSNFGKAGETMELPFKVGRSYSRELDDYVKKLSDPPADKIMKAIYDGTTEELKWKELSQIEKEHRENE